MLKKRENKIPEISSSEMNHPGDQTESGKINICERGGPYIVWRTNKGPIKNYNISTSTKRIKQNDNERYLGFFWEIRYLHDWLEEAEEKMILKNSWKLAEISEDLCFPAESRSERCTAVWF